MRKLNLVAFRSSLATGPIEETHAELLAGLRRDFEVSILAPGEEAGREGAVLAFIASGGSERAFVDYYRRLPQPVLLLADGLANSLAASLEILAWVREVGGRAEILHGGEEYLRSRVEASIAEASARRRLASARIGAIGQSSEWLVASSVDYAAARGRWGVAFEDIELAVLDRYLAQADEAEARRAADSFIAGAASIAEAGPADVVAAARVYLALKRLAADRGLDALTLKCFDILGTHGTTGCMALALLNQEGLVSGCEGDQRTAFTMLLARALTGEAPFMANPARVDAEEGRVVFAHCTIAPCMTREYRIRSHFESGLGVGIQGILPEGPATVLKVGGASLDRYFASSGRIAENLDDPRRCRTQIGMDLDGDAARYFLRAPLANHHVILAGDHAARVAAFLDGEGLARVPARPR